MDEQLFKKAKSMRYDLDQLKKVVEKSKKNNFELSVIENGGQENMWIPFYAQKYLQKAILKAYEDLLTEYKKL